MPQRYREEAKAIVESLIHAHEKAGLTYSALATGVLLVLNVYLIDGLLRLGLIGPH